MERSSSIVSGMAVDTSVSFSRWQQGEQTGAGAGVVGKCSIENMLTQKCVCHENHQFNPA